jgi:Tfp pilus assembly protein PilF
VAHQVGRHDVAADYIGRAIALNGDAAEYHNNLARAYHALQRYSEAAVSCRRALELQPDWAETHNNLGLALKEQGKLDEATACFRRAIRLKPSLAEAHNSLGNALTDQRKLAEAIVSYRLALGLKPDFAEAYNNLGNPLIELGELEEAAICLQRALELKPDYPDTLSNLGLVLKEQGKVDEALALHRRAIELNPDFAPGHYNLGLILLLRGEWEEGWRQYERRLDCLIAPRKFSRPRWNGERTEGQTILIYHEQGLGDTLQFARYVPLVRHHAGAARVILETQPPLARLLAQNSGWDAEIVSGLNMEESDLPPFDYQIPLLSLPLALRRFEPLPIAHSVIQADPNLRRLWRERLGAGEAIRVGLAWAGNPAHKLDRLRSIPPESLLPLLQIPGFQFYSLQVGLEAERSHPLKEVGLIDLTEHLTDFAETAALAAELDLILSVDTASAHLAGAMGRPVWTLLPFQAEWRWGMSGETTPWYPTMRLFRQPAFGDWGAVVQRVAAELGRFVNDK